MDSIPKGVGAEDDEDLLLRHGLVVKIPDISGSPTVIDGKITDPMKRNRYTIKFIGIDGEEIESNVKIGRKIWFDGTAINQ